MKTGDGDNPKILTLDPNEAQLGEKVKKILLGNISPPRTS